MYFMLCYVPIYFFTASSSLIYYLTRLKFGWTEQDFTEWVAISSIASSLATLCVMPLLSYKLKLHDSVIGIIGSVFGVAANLVRTFAPYSWMFYLSTAVGESKSFSLKFQYKIVKTKFEC